MSNPGVITLTEKEISASKSFRVEDNLGEAIHFHYNDIRIDLSIKELLYIGKLCDETIYDLVKADDFNLDDYENDFLNEYSQCLMDLEKVVADHVSINEMYYLTKNKMGLPVRKKFNKKNATTILNIAKLSNKKLTHNGKIVLFNDNLTVMAGKEQVAQMYLEGKEKELEVARMYFSKNKHSVSAHPWVPFLFKWNKKRFIKVAKKWP